MTSKICFRLRNSFYNQFQVYNIKTKDNYIEKQQLYIVRYRNVGSIAKKRFV